MGRIHIGFKGLKTLPKLKDNRVSHVKFLEAVIEQVDKNNFISLSMNGNLQDWDLDEPGSKTVPFEDEDGVIKIYLIYDAPIPGGYFSISWPDRIKMQLQNLIAANDLRVTDFGISPDVSSGLPERVVQIEGSAKK